MAHGQQRIVSRTTWLQARSCMAAGSCYSCNNAPGALPLRWLPSTVTGPHGRARKHQQHVLVVRGQLPLKGNRNRHFLAAARGLAAATGPYRIRWSSQLPSSPTHTGSATDTHGGPQAAAGAPTPALQDVPLREPNGAPAGPRAVPRAPQGIWTSLRPQQLPQVAAHAVRLEAMRRALARVAAERGVEEEPGARDGETGGGHREQGGGVRSHSCAGVELEHVG